MIISSFKTSKSSLPAEVSMWWDFFCTARFVRQEREGPLRTSGAVVDQNFFSKSVTGLWLPWLLICAHALWLMLAVILAPALQKSVTTFSRWRSDKTGNFYSQWSKIEIINVSPSDLNVTLNGDTSACSTGNLLDSSRGLSLSCLTNLSIQKKSYHKETSATRATTVNLFHVADNLFGLVETSCSIVVLHPVNKAC